MNRNRDRYKGLYLQYLRITFLTLISYILVQTAVFSEGDGDSYQPKINKLISNGGYIAAKEDRDILSFNPDRQFIPASIWKLLTALAAMETLGREYHFKTEFYINGDKDLYIKGFGDPFLISEEIDLIFQKLKEKGIAEINNIHLDGSSFNLTEPPPGSASSLNPYDAVSGGLAVNFNSIYFYVDENNTVTSAEKQTPTISIMKDMAAGFEMGRHRINISGKPENVLRHTGEIFRAFQKKYKIPGKGSETEKRVPDGLKPLYRHYSSKTLFDVIREMMLYSNNYIANQIFLTMGAGTYGYPATWEKGRKFLEHYLEDNFTRYINEIKVSEGSGISRKNRITPRAFMEVLKRYKPYADTLPLDDGKYIKSGTLKGVYSYAGYFKHESGYDSFVIILNQEKNVRGRILELMEEWHESRP